MNDIARVLAAAAATVPAPRERNIIKWAEDWYVPIGSARCDRYRWIESPWTREPLEMAGGDRCKLETFIKPIQAGGSDAGEIFLAYRICTENSGDLQYNWRDDGKATERWDKRVNKRFKACKPLVDRAPSMDKQDGKWKKGMIIFDHCNFVMQGAFNPSNLDSDTIRFQVNEEIHSWEAGRMAKAKGRTTASWNSVIFNISNAGRKGSQLHEAFLSGTQQHWQDLCPGCGQHHEMRVQWDDKKPELGGLRYDAEGCRLPDGFYDYKKLEPTIFYQMPCGAQIRDDITVRRAMSEGGCYGPPKNEGASLMNRSHTLQAVSVFYIPWILLIEEKHAALRAMRLGDPEPWWRYLTERECKFFDPQEDRPVVGKVIINKGLKKNREGLKNRVARFAALDRQRGTLKLGQFPHWWCVVRDVDAAGNSLLVWEGKFLTDEDAVAKLKELGVKPTCVVADSGDGDSTMHVYQFCLRNGYNAIKGSMEPFFSHPDRGSRIFSVEKLLYKMMNLPCPVSEDPAKEPLFFHYSKSGIRNRLHWLRGSSDRKWEVPGDVSSEYHEHMEAEELQERRKPRSGEIESVWMQLKARNDLFVCECYIALLMEMAGLIGAEAAAAAVAVSDGKEEKSLLEVAKTA